MHLKGRNEPVASPGDGLDVPRLERVVAECFSQLCDCPREDVRSHKCRRPGDLKQLVFRHQPITVRYQVAEDVERLRLERDDLAGAADFHSAEIDGHVPKFIEFSGHHNFLIACRNNITSLRPEPHVIVTTRVRQDAQGGSVEGDTMRFGVASLMALVLWTTDTAASPEDVVFSVRASGAVLVPVGINGHGPFTFVLDTGSSHSTVSSELAVRLALPAVAKTSVVTIAGPETQLVVYVHQMAIGTATGDNLTPSVVSTAELRAIERSVDGILGRDFLSALDYTLDYRRNRLRWTADNRNDERTRLPLIREADRLFVRLPCNGQGAPVLMVPDSGSEGFVIFERNGRTPVVVDYTTEFVAVAVLAGRQVGRRAVVRELEVGGVTLRNQRAVVVTRDGPSAVEGDGLMPLHQFSSVSFNNSEGYLVVRQ